MRNWKLTFFTILCLGFVACGTGKDNHEITETIGYENSAITKLLEAEDFEIKVYDCHFQRTEQGDLIEIEIHYPQFRLSNEGGMGAPEEINRINQQIFEYLMQEEYDEWLDSRYNAGVTYEVSYMGKDYISVIFEGYHDAYNHEKTPSALTFDLRTGELISLDKILSQEELWQYISENQSAVVEGEWVSGVGGREGVISYVETYLQEKEHLYDFALTEGGLKIIVFSEFDNRIYYIAEIQLERKQ